MENKLTKLEKVQGGKFLNLYNLEYTREDGSKKIYETVSRKSDLTLDDMQDSSIVAQAVGMIMFNHDMSKIMLQQEFRMAMNKWVYNFPGGLIDSGEDAEQAATRELWEETGLHLDKVIAHLPVTYTSVGISNETSETIVGTASGEFKASTSVDEQIKPGWYSKEDIKALLEKKVPMSMRTMSVLWMWVSMDTLKA